MALYPSYYITMNNKEKINYFSPSTYWSVNFNSLSILDDLPKWWMELRTCARPRGYRFWRKTKAGLWEEIATIHNTLNLESLTVDLASKWFNDMWEKEQKKYPHAAMKVTTLSNRQIYSTYYGPLLKYISCKVHMDKMFGISINKGEDYLIYHNTLPGDNLKPIADYFCRLSKQHKGIRSFHQAKLDKADDYLYWGWLTFNDDYKISVAIDEDFKLFNKYKDDLVSINLSYLTNKYFTKHIKHKS